MSTYEFALRCLTTYRWFFSESNPLSLQTLSRGNGMPSSRGMNPGDSWQLPWTPLWESISPSSGSMTRMILKKSRRLISRPILFIYEKLAFVCIRPVPSITALARDLIRQINCLRSILYHRGGNRWRHFCGVVKCNTLVNPKASWSWLNSSKKSLQSR